VKFGFYRRKSDSRVIQRFYCKRCKKTYSHAIQDPAYGQNKRRINYRLACLLASCISLRRAALLLGVTYKTITRKLRYLGTLCRQQQDNFLAQLKEVSAFQFDELQTIEHTKCKPLSIATAVTKDRKLLGAVVSRMPATGHLAKIARKKYGFRPDQRQAGLKALFSNIKSSLATTLSIDSDQHPYYLPLVKQFFKQASYRQSKGEKAAISGQGELKKKVRDPLFTINHTLAMLRANINRLVRRSWCTTKDPDRLSDHLAIYIAFHNRLLVPS